MVIEGNQFKNMTGDVSDMYPPHMYNVFAS